MQISNFTMTANGRLREIITDVTIFDSIHGALSLEDTERLKADPRVLNTKALWDTGATNCVITPSCAKALNLKPIGIVNTRHAGGASFAKSYLINVMLPNGVGFKDVRFTECVEQEGSFGIIIGMDIITSGDFAITNVGGETVFTFRCPSYQKIDFVEEAKIKNGKKPKINGQKIGRNDLCPCGSGKKYKNCHCGKPII